MMKEILEKIEELKKQVQELSFQQDLNQEQLLAIINDGFKEIKKKYEAREVSDEDIVESFRCNT